VPQPTPSSLAALTANDAVAIAIVVLLALLVAVAALRLARRRRAPPGPPARLEDIERELER
jgi:fused signal recognition particle receptor